MFQAPWRNRRDVLTQILMDNRSRQNENDMSFWFAVLIVSEDFLHQDTFDASYFTYDSTKEICEHLNSLMSST